MLRKLFKGGNYSQKYGIPILQRSGRGHPFESTPPGQSNSPVPQMVGQVIGQELPSFPVGPFIFLGKKIRLNVLIIPIQLGKIH